MGTNRLTEEARIAVESLKLIYKILRFIEKSNAVELPDFSPIMPGALGIPKCQWVSLVRELQESGYIRGITITRCIDGTEDILEPFNPRITIAGMEYLSENSTMKKIAELINGITTVIK